MIVKMSWKEVEGILVEHFARKGLRIPYTGAMQDRPITYYMRKNDIIREMEPSEVPVVIEFQLNK